MIEGVAGVIGGSVRAALRFRCRRPQGGKLTMCLLNILEQAVERGRGSSLRGFFGLLVGSIPLWFGKRWPCVSVFNQSIRIVVNCLYGRDWHGAGLIPALKNVRELLRRIVHLL